MEYKPANSSNECTAFEIFYLSELLAEGIITKDLFDLAYSQLVALLNKEKQIQEELEQ